MDKSTLLPNSIGNKYALSKGGVGNINVSTNTNMIDISTIMMDKSTDMADDNIYILIKDDVQVKLS